MTDLALPTAAGRIVGSGEMADRIRSFPWQDNILGPIESWPAELVAMVNMALSTKEMAAVYWGPEMVLLYNDTYLPHLTNRHPALGKPFWVVWEEARQQVEELMESPYNTGQTFVTPPVPLELVRDGQVERTFYSMTGSPIFLFEDQQSKVGGVYLTLTDHTANVLQAQQLAASEARAGRVLASIGDAVIVTDAEGRITIMNGVAEQLTRWSEADARGQLLHEVFHIVNEDTRAVVPCPVAKVRETGLVTELANHTILIGRDGTETHIDDSAAPIRNEAGNLIGVVLVFRDVGRQRAMEKERRQALAEAREAADQLQFSLDVARLGRWDYDPKTGLVSVDERIHSIFGSKGVNGDPNYWLSFLPPEDSDRVLEHFTGVLLGKHDYDIEYRVCPPGDEVRWVRSKGRTTGPKGSPDHFFAVIEDITERKLTEEALRQSEKLTAVGRLASTMAHEINNPLESVTNLLYLARQAESPEEIRPYLEIADAELRRAAIITSQALRFHKQATRPTLSSFQQLTLDLFKGRHSRLNNVGASTEERDRTTKPVLCFEGEIRQVIDNMVANAIDALSGRGGKLRVRGRDGTDWKTERTGMVLTFADNGSGMSAATQKKLFDAFFTTKGIGGTGLGLWVSSEIIARHAGRVLLRSREGRGTVFSIFLPYDAIERTSSRSSTGQVRHTLYGPDQRAR